jgi:hypothetical protein
MLPFVRLPNKIEEGGDNGEILNPSTIAYLREISGNVNNPFRALRVPLPTLRFLEIMKCIDVRGNRVFHASNASRLAIKLAQKEVEEVTEDATIVFSDLPLVETLSLGVHRLGSTLVAVIGDIISRSEVQLLYLVCGMYRSVRMQPLTVSYADPERVIIATDLMHQLEMPLNPPFDFAMSRFFMTKVDEINSIHGQMRLELSRTPREKLAGWATNFLDNITP